MLDLIRSALGPLAVAVATLAPRGAYAEAPPTCEGSAPAEHSCEVTVTLDRPVIGVLVMNAMSVGTMAVEVESDAGYKRTAVCASAFPADHCQTITAGPRVKLGDTITIRAVAVGQGSWWVNLLEPDNYPCPESLWGCTD